MNQTVQLWMPSILALFGSLIVVVITAWLNTRALSAQIDAVRAEVRAEMGGLHAELNSEIGGLRAEMRAEIGGLRAEMRAEISGLRTEVDGLRAEMRAEIGGLRAEIGGLRAETRQLIAEAELRIIKEILELKGRVERLEEQRGLIRQS